MRPVTSQPSCPFPFVPFFGQADLGEIATGVFNLEELLASGAELSSTWVELYATTSTDAADAPGADDGAPIGKVSVTTTALEAPR